MRALSNRGANATIPCSGRELFYRLRDQILTVDVDTSSGFTVSRAAGPFAGRYRASGRDFDASPDGTRFVMMRNDEPRTTPRIRVLLDWWGALDSRTAHR
jgi:hypothetical protein